MTQLLYSLRFPLFYIALHNALHIFNGGRGLDCRQASLVTSLGCTKCDLTLFVWNKQHLPSKSGCLDGDILYSMLFQNLYVYWYFIHNGAIRDRVTHVMGTKTPLAFGTL